MSQWLEKVWAFLLGPASLAISCDLFPGRFSASGGKWPVGKTTVWLMWFWFCWWRSGSGKSGKVDVSGRCGPLPPCRLREGRELFCDRKVRVRNVCELRVNVFSEESVDLSFPSWFHAASSPYVLSALEKAAAFSCFTCLARVVNVHSSQGWNSCLLSFKSI